MNKIKLDKSWRSALGNELNKEYILNLKQFLNDEVSEGKVIFPKQEDIYNAFNFTPFDKVKVVIIGQDPYHGENQAHGLCFSVKKGIKVPPSLKNIYKELRNDIGFEAPDHGNLEQWAHEGVLLLNTVLTVEQSKAGSHRKKGWEQFTDKVIEVLNEKKENLVFILWGRDAQKKGEHINRDKHLVLESAHPSPFSARMFFNQHHFSTTNKYLEEHGVSGVNWHLH